MKNSGELDQNAHKEQFDLGLHCLLRLSGMNKHIQIYWKFYHQKMKIFR